MGGSAIGHRQSVLTSCCILPSPSPSPLLRFLLLPLPDVQVIERLVSSGQFERWVSVGGSQAVPWEGGGREGL